MASSSTDLFFINIEHRFTDISVQVRHAAQKGIDNTARSGYYRFSIILACTITEGLLYKIVENQIGINGLGKKKLYTEPHVIPPQFSDKSLRLCICKEETIKLLPNKTTFNHLINYSREKGILSKKECAEIKTIMQLRNRIHVQSLTGIDRGYTKNKLDKVFETNNFLIKKMLEMHKT